MYLSPEGFASILWKDGSRVKEAAEAMKITAQDLKGFGIIDKIIKEPYGGAHRNPLRMAIFLKKNLIEEVKALKEKDINELTKERYNKFRSFGKA